MGGKKTGMISVVSISIYGFHIQGFSNKKEKVIFVAEKCRNKLKQIKFKENWWQKENPMMTENRILCEQQALVSGFISDTVIK